MAHEEMSEVAEASVDGMDRKPLAPFQDARSTWVPGQWDAWKMYHAREQAIGQCHSNKRKKLKDIVKGFNEVEQANGWPVHSGNAIRAHKRRMGEADTTYNLNPMTDAERKRGRALYEEHGWKVATQMFNEETGRQMSQSTLIAATRRVRPDSVPDIPLTTRKRRWVEEEVKILKTLTNRRHAQRDEAYSTYLASMALIDPKHEPRSWQAFVKELERVRQAVVKTGRPGLSSRAWKEENDDFFYELATKHSSKTAFVKAAALHFHCTQAIVRQLFEQRHPRLKNEAPGETARGENVGTRPDIPENEGYDAEQGNITPAPGFPRLEADEEEICASPSPVADKLLEPQLEVQALSTAEAVKTFTNVDISDDSDRFSTELGVSTSVVEAEAVLAVDVGRVPIDCESFGDPDRISNHLEDIQPLTKYEDKERAVEYAGTRMSPTGNDGAVLDRSPMEDVNEEFKATVVQDGEEKSEERWPRSNYATQTPWIDKSSTPERVGEFDRVGDDYARRRWTSKISDEPSQTGISSKDQPGDGMPVEVVDFQGDEGPYDTYEDLVNYNKRRGIMVQKVELKKGYELVGHKLWYYLIDNIAFEATRNPERTMNRGSIYDQPIYLERWVQRQQDALQEDQGRTGYHKPALSWRRLTEMAVTVCAVCNYAPYDALLMRHFGPRHCDKSSYGDCCGETCCLNIDFGFQNLYWTRNCRHWQLFRSSRVYMDGFKSQADYRLALALSSVLQARNHVKMTRSEIVSKIAEGEAPPYEVDIDVIGVIPVEKFFDKMECAKSRPYAMMLLECMAVILPDLRGQGSLRHQYREATKPTTFGKLRVGGLFYDAVLYRYDGQDFWLVDVAVSVAAGWGSVTWIAEEQLLTHSRRCGVLEDCAEISIIRNLSARDFKVSLRPRKVQLAIDKGRIYQKMAPTLDPAQARALDAAVRYVGVIPIRGPFGCGKTRLIATIVAVLLDTFETLGTSIRIFVTSETNSAIDEDLRRVVDDNVVPRAKIVRLGEPSRNIESRYLPFFLSERVRTETESVARTLHGPQRRQHMRAFEERVLHCSSVVFATASTLGREPYQELPSQVTINDEGAQTLESALVQTLRNHTTTLIAIGDPNQLPGYIECPTDKVERYESGDRRHKLAWSVIHAFTHEHAQFPGTTLTAQYRSHPAIGSWLSGFYDFKMQQRGPQSSDYLRQVVIGVEEDCESWNAPNKQVVMQRSRIALVSCVNGGLRRDGSLCGTKHINRAEVWKVIEILLQAVRECRATRHQAKKSVIVITPYNEQKAILCEALHQCSEWWHDQMEVTVTTIDSSQGREADIAIVSMVRTNGLGFMADNKARTLVALSRARDYVFVLANRRVFEDDFWWRCLYAKAMEAEVEAAQARDDTYSEEAKTKLGDQRRLRELCTPGWANAKHSSMHF